MLVTPALVLAVYVIFRPNYLDDRNLVILMPFVALCAAHTLQWLASCARWLRVIAALASVGLTISAATSAVGAAYLFQVDDTRLLAERWQAHWLPPGVRVRDLGTAMTSPQGERDIDYLVTNTQDDLRLLQWFSLHRSPRAVDTYRRLSGEGKLLQRIELLPRGFTTPTFEYFDLDPSTASHVFPPPDDVEPFRDTLIFLDRDAVPRHVGAVFDRQPVTLTLVSRRPLRRLDLALTGAGRAVVRQGASTVEPSLDPVHPTVVRFTPRRTWPWFKHFYSLELRAPDGTPTLWFSRLPATGPRRRWETGSGTAPSRRSTDVGAPAGSSRPGSSTSHGPRRAADGERRPGGRCRTSSGCLPASSAPSPSWSTGPTETCGASTTADWPDRTSGSGGGTPIG